jgi:hypothetical protein
MYPRHYFDLYRPRLSETSVFVGMPFAATAQARWADVLQPAIHDAGLQAYRVDMDVPSDSILEDIMRGILDARLLLFDITKDQTGGRNGNVMYEIGLAHAMRHPEEILVVRGDGEPLLFDLSSIRVHTLQFGEPVNARAHLARLLGQLRQGLRSLEGIVLDKIVGSLDEVCLGLLASHANVPHFSLTDSSKAFDPQTVAARAAIRHLLDQGVLSMIWRKDSRTYAYQWTYVGSALLRYLGLADGQRPASERA